ncbi:MAG: T9SS type A sorting domain-containing protein, partial [Bacteroidales bacterium]|nr:T9SS type A sorting domain-containing protein [Bacteroidales bacterium]
TINYGTHNVTTVTECESYTWTAGTGLTYTESGTYIYHYNNSSDCPSADTLHLTIHNGTHNATSVTECESYTWTAGTGQTYTESGTYIHYYNNSDECPSTDTLHLTINYGTHNVTTVTECESYTWAEGTGQTYTESGTYIHYYNNSYDCPSADTLHLTILNGTHNVTSITECESYTWTAGTGLTYSESGTYVHYYNNGDGCPSTDTLHLTILNGTHNVTTVTECESYTWTEGTGQTYTESGTYIHHYNNGDGCPSADTLYLTITTVSINEYNSLSGLHIFVYPNPAHDVVNIKVDDEFTHLTNADIYDATGRRVKTLRWAEANSTQQVNMQEFAPGLYFIQLFNDKQSLGIHKIIKQ